MTAARPTSLIDLGQVDRRCRAWRWRSRKRAEVVASLGGDDNLTAHQREAIELLLGMSQLLEAMQADLAAGKVVDVERFLQVSKEVRRLNGELGLPRTVRPAPTLRDHIAKRSAVRAGALPAGEAA